GRRRAGARGATAALAAAVALLVSDCGGDDDGGERTGAQATGAAAEAPPQQLPRGGRTILPGHRVVAFYGAPQDPQLGVLGIGTPDRAGRRLARVARRYERPGTPVLPAMELIAVIAAGHPGADGMYRTRQDPKVIRRYLRAARRMKALLILDVQPGRSDFLQEARRLRRWLRQPDVSLALDPEWRVNAPDVPGQVIGTVSAREVNAVSFWLDRLAQRHRLPQKLLLVHRFTEGMIDDVTALKPRRNLALALNVDGFGDRAVKRARYHELAAAAEHLHDGFKLFYEEDTDLLTPRQVLRLRPPPDVVVYE
ncbi:MAG: hypothetical protein IRZ32_11935, partial [Solirubrobacteraceae bacterium]|nr:hypothetical protein [Solirubrobacteraceae bacterium]